MITLKQKKYYIDIIVEIIKANFAIKYENVQLNPLEEKDEPLMEKVKAYHLFFKVVCSSYPVNKKIEDLSNTEFNNFLEEIRIILAENTYVLTVDKKSFEKAVSESKKNLNFDNYLKKGA